MTMTIQPKVLERAVDVVLVIAALTMLGMYASRRARPQLELPQSLPPKDWQREVATGIRTGPQHANVTIVEFMDFQCPFCARWAARVDSLIDEFPDEIQVVFHHFPLTATHPHALSAAVAAECADQQGAFRAFKSAVLLNQGDIGVKPWSAFAVEASVPDIERYERCMIMPVDSFPRIAHGRKLAADHKMSGTPTVWVNGRVDQPSLDQLRETVHKRLGRRPLN